MAIEDGELVCSGVASALTAGRKHCQYLPAVFSFAVVQLFIFATHGCATYKPSVPPSKGHINAAQFPDKTAEDKILAPVTSNNYVPPPKPQVKLPTYSVVVSEVPVKELLFALSRDTRQNIDVHPSVQGLVSLNAIDETLPAILERVSQQVNIRYRTEGKTVIVMPDTPFFKSYKVNYVNIGRDTASSIGVSGEISGSTTNAGGGQSTGGGGAAGGTSSTKVETKSVNNFWEVLRQNIDSILSATKALNQNADQRAERAEAQAAARQERIAQAEAVSRAGANAASLFSTAFQSNTPADGKNDVVVNPVTGTVTILGTEKQQALIQQYLDSVSTAAQRQVLIEATIVEVQLSNNYQAGVDWSRLAASIGNGASFTQQLIGAPHTGGPTGLTIGYTNPNSNVNATIRLLEQFGNTRVLSSPKLMALNNQTALLKVVDNIVYFHIEAQTNTNQSTSTTTFTTTANTVAVGLVMSVLPQVTDSGTVNLTVRPTISRISGSVQDPNPALRAQFNAVGIQISPAIPNLIPQIQVREMESVLQAGSGQTIILGGLMQDNVQRDRDAVPGLGRLPSPVGDAFSYRNEAVSKNELVIFLKPTVINNPSLESDELKFFRRFLPTIDPTGKTP